MIVKIAPSILSADRKILLKEVSEIEPYADLIHVDIMDGKFVPLSTFKPEEIKQINSRLPKDVHLMVEYPQKEGFIDNYIDAGAAIITIHQEAKDNVQVCLAYLKQKGIRASISIRPPTHLESIYPYLNLLDMVLIMSVEPGYSGQKFIPEVLTKVKKLRDLKPNLDIEIDGGINKDTINAAFQAGANVFVAGSAIFSKKNRKKAIQELRDSAK